MRYVLFEVALIGRFINPATRGLMATDNKNRNNKETDLYYFKNYIFC